MTELWVGRPDARAAWLRAGILVMLLIGGQATARVMGMAIEGPMEELGAWLEKHAPAEPAEPDPDPAMETYGAGTGLWNRLKAVIQPVAAIVFAWYTVRRTNYKATKEGLEVNSVFFTSKHQRVPWAKVNAVTWRQTLLEKVFGLHRMKIHLTDGGEVDIMGLRDPSAIRNLVLTNLGRATHASATCR